MMQQGMATFMEGAWYVSVVDVEDTLRTVCKKVLTDTSVDRETRKRRARALKCLGQVFLDSVSEETKAGKVMTLRERLETMFPQAAPAAEANGADGEDDDDIDLGFGPEDEGDVGAAHAAAGPPDRDVLSAMSVRELKAVLAAQGISSDGMLEKTEFIDAICAHAAGR